MKVLFTIGKGRSGSTLLDSILDGIPGVFATGELWRRWGKWPMERYRCGCGRSVEDCDLWSRVLARAYARSSGELGVDVTSQSVLSWESALWATSGNAHLVRWTLFGRPFPPPLDRLLTVMKHTYRAIGEITGCEVIVDSSKWPLLPGPLGLVEGVEPRLVHLVRDSRAVAHSWTRQKKFYPGGPDMPVFSPLISATSWWCRNGLAEFAARQAPDGASVRVRYEDLTNRPESTLRSILALIAKSGAPLPLIDDTTLEVDANHTMWGNPSRFRQGVVRLRTDNRWKSEQDRNARLLVTGLTAPLLARYGYPI